MRLHGDIVRWQPHGRWQRLGRIALQALAAIGFVALMIVLGAVTTQKG